MKYDKLVIISTYTLDKRTNILFDTRRLVEKGVDVEYWDVGPLTYNIELQTDAVEGVNIVRFDCKKSFREYVRNTASKKTLYLVFMTYAPKSYFCYRELSRNNLDMAYCVNGLQPTPFTIHDRKGIIKSKVKQLFSLYSWKHLFFKQIWRTKLLKPLSYQFNTASAASPRYKVDNKTCFVNFNSGDYVLSTMANDNIVGKPYIVFLDQYLPKHPDNKVMGFKDLNEEQYYNQLNRLFDIIEREYNCKVVVAAHPVAKGYNENNPFDGRDIYFFQTHTLVKYSLGVISHNTTAYSFAVANYKPGMVLCSDELIKEMNTPYEVCQMYAKVLNWPLINIDHIEQDIRFNNVDIDLYNSFKYSYLTNPDSEKITNSDILFTIMKGE